MGPREASRPEAGNGRAEQEPPSDAYAIPATNATTFGLSSTSTVLGTLSLPAGSYVASAKTVLRHHDGSGPQTDAGVTTCELQIPGSSGPATDLDVDQVFLPQVSPISVPTSLQAAFTLDAASSVQFVCSSTGTNNSAGAAQLQAIKVGTLHESS